jgi:hypothetical protein
VRQSSPARIAGQSSDHNWTSDPRVRPLMQSIRRNPPAVKLYEHGLWSAWRDGLVADQPAYDHSDERVDALHRIANEHFLRAEAEGGREAALAFGPDVATAIGYALAEKLAA